MAQAKNLNILCIGIWTNKTMCYTDIDSLIVHVKIEGVFMQSLKQVLRRKHMHESVELREKDNSTHFANGWI